MFKTLRGRVIASYFIVVIISLLLVSLFFLFFLSRYIRDRDSKELLREVTAIARDVEKLGASQATQSTPTTPTTPGQPNAGNRVGVLPLLNAQAQALQVKFLLAGPGGRVLAESSNEPVLGDRTVQLPARVLSESGPRISERYFPRLRQDYLFATAPAKVQGKQVFLIALKTVENVRSVALSLIGYVSLAGGIALALSMLLALYFSGALSKPIREVTAAARRMADGDY